MPTEEVLDFLDLEVEDAVEPTTLKEDTEYELVIAGVPEVVEETETVSKHIRVVLECPSEETSKSLGYTLWIPGKGDSPKQRNAAKWKIKTFKEAFGIDPGSRMVFSDWTGQIGWATVKVRGEYNDVATFLKRKK